jgi:hypothetical protein
LVHEPSRLQKVSARKPRRAISTRSNSTKAQFHHFLECHHQPETPRQNNLKPSHEPAQPGSPRTPRSAAAQFHHLLVVVVLMGLILAFILIKPLFQETPTIVTYQGNSSKDEEMETRKMTNQIQRKPSAPSSSLAKVIAANTTSPTAVPIPEVDVPDPSTDFGSGDDFGDGWGSGGDGGGGGFGNIPATMRKRCSKEDRLQRLQENGGTEKCEEAVVKGLDWLQKTQHKDGSWGGATRAP